MKRLAAALALGLLIAPLAVGAQPVGKVYHRHAKALGLTIPPSVLVWADELLIE